MKKKILSILLVILLAGASIAFALEFGTAKTSGLLSASAVVVSGHCYLSGVILYSNGSSNAEVLVYDNGTGPTGTNVFKLHIWGTDNYGGKNFAFPVECFNGIYATVSGDEASCILEYIVR